jgi:type II secretory pathway pseudopilin PulG
MAPSTKIGKRAEAGFTLAAVMIIMSVMMIFVAYTVPRQWSIIMQRDREQQTLFIMQQYAKAVEAFRRKNNTYPVSMQQLVEARQPRFLRCPKDGCVDPLTGQIDWLVIPQSQAPAPTGGAALPPGVVQNPQAQNPQQPTTTAPAPGTAPGTTTATTTAPPGVPIKDYAGGPFVGIRPNKTGSSLILVNGADHYEQWMYTALDYQQDRTARQQAAVKVWQ